MKKSLILAASAVILMGGMASTASAKAFCAACHAGHADKVGPSLTTISEAYGGVDAVFAFLNSDADLDPKVAAFAGKKNIMKAQLKKYRHLDDAKKAEVRAWFEGEVK